jgi:hypothetical protein
MGQVSQALVLRPLRSVVFKGSAHLYGRTSNVNIYLTEKIAVLVAEKINRVLDPV